MFDCRNYLFVWLIIDSRCINEVDRLCVGGNLNYFLFGDI